MDFKISLKIEDDYLLIISTGTIGSLKEHMIFDSQISQEILNQGIKKVLVNHIKLKYASGVSTVFNTAKFIDYYIENIPSKIKIFKIAVIPSPQVKHNYKFWETYGRNRGFDIRVFYSMEDALKYIKS